MSEKYPDFCKTRRNILFVVASKPERRSGTRRNSVPVYKSGNLKYTPLLIKLIKI